MAAVYKRYYIWAIKRSGDGVCVFCGKKRGYTKDLDQAGRFTEAELLHRKIPIMDKINYRDIRGANIPAVAVECCDIHLVGRVAQVVLVD